MISSACIRMSVAWPWEKLPRDYWITTIRRGFNVLERHQRAGVSWSGRWAESIAFLEHRPRAGGIPWNRPDPHTKSLSVAWRTASYRRWRGLLSQRRQESWCTDGSACWRSPIAGIAVEPPRWNWCRRLCCPSGRLSAPSAGARICRRPFHRGQFAQLPWESGWYCEPNSPGHHISPANRWIINRTTLCLALTYWINL